MTEDGPRIRPPKSRLRKVSEALWTFGLIGLVIGPVVTLPPALVRGSRADIGLAAAAGLGPSAALLLSGFVLARLASGQEKDL